jgi:putative SOS response-associated peptidase YedK
VGGRPHLQSLFDHHEPSRHRRAFSHHQPQRRQPASDARRVSGLSRASGPQRRRIARADDDALGKPAATAHWRATVTNIRNNSSPHWRMWLKPENRCLVPFNSFAEYEPEPNPETKKKDVVWFAINGDRPLQSFAGIWTEFKGDRGTKSKPIPGPHLVYGFLTTSPNAVVEPIHPRPSR